MREQIGWCEPGKKKYCTLGCKSGPHAERFKDHVVPVFADDETGLENAVTLLWQQVMNRILVNQQRTMRALRVLDEMRGSQEQRDLNEAVARTEDIIDKVKSF